MTFDEAYFYGLRTIARKRALDEMNALILSAGGASVLDGTSLASVDDDAIRYAEVVWPTHYGEATHHGFAKA